MFERKHASKIPFIILGALAWLLIFKFSKNELAWELNHPDFFDQKIVESKTYDENLKKFFQSVENNTVDSSFDLIDSVSDAEVREYLKKFYEYYNADKKTRDITFLINNMSIIKSYFVNNGFSEVDSIACSEIIPFYCIKNFEVQRNKPNKLYSICELYLKKTEKNHISQKSAIIICLKVRSFYRMEGLGKTNDYVGDVEKMIDSYKQQFPLELGANPIYKEEAAYLDRFNNLCQSIKNKKLFDKWDRINFNDKIVGLGE